MLLFAYLDVIQVAVLSLSPFVIDEMHPRQDFVCADWVHPQQSGTIPVQSIFTYPALRSFVDGHAFPERTGPDILKLFGPKAMEAMRAEDIYRRL